MAGLLVDIDPRIAMRPLALALLALATFRPARSQPQAIDPAKLVGRWSGSGSFFSADLQKRVGSLPFVTEFKPDRSGSGSVGQATLQDVRIKPTRDHIEVKAKLVGSIGADPALAKDHLILLVTMRNDSTLQGEFHLKSNEMFDSRMREGRVVLTRIR
jgi:hypothetical protein